MRGDNICLNGNICKIVPKISLLSWNIVLIPDTRKCDAWPESRKDSYQPVVKFT